MNLEREEERSVIKALVVLESRKGYFKKTGPAPEESVSEELPVIPSAWLLPLDSSSLLAEGKRKVSLTVEHVMWKKVTLSNFSHSDSFSSPIFARIRKLSSYLISRLTLHASLAPVPKRYLARRAHQSKPTNVSGAVEVRPTRTAEISDC